MLKERCPHCSSLWISWDRQDKIPSCITCGWRDYDKMKVPNQRDEIEVINSRGERGYFQNVSFDELPDDDDVPILQTLRQTRKRDRVLLELR